MKGIILITLSLVVFLSANCKVREGDPSQAQSVGVGSSWLPTAHAQELGMSVSDMMRRGKYECMTIIKMDDTSLGRDMNLYSDYQRQFEESLQYHSIFNQKVNLFARKWECVPGTLSMSHQGERRWLACCFTLKQMGKNYGAEW